MYLFSSFRHALYWDIFLFKFGTFKTINTKRYISYINIIDMQQFKLYLIIRKKMLDLFDRKYCLRTNTHTAILNFKLYSILGDIYEYNLNHK